MIVVSHIVASARFVVIFDFCLCVAVYASVMHINVVFAKRAKCSRHRCVHCFIVCASCPVWPVLIRRLPVSIFMFVSVVSIWVKRLFFVCDCTIDRRAPVSSVSAWCIFMVPVFQVVVSIVQTIFRRKLLYVVVKWNLNSSENSGLQMQVACLVL